MRFKTFENYSDDLLSKIKDQLELEFEDSSFITAIRTSYDSINGLFIMISLDIHLPDDVVSQEEDVNDRVDIYVNEEGMQIIQKLMDRFCKKFDYTLIDIEADDVDHYSYSEEYRHEFNYSVIIDV